MHKPITEGRAQVFALMQFHRGSEPARDAVYLMHRSDPIASRLTPTGLVRDN